MEGSHDEMPNRASTRGNRTVQQSVQTALHLPVAAGTPRTCLFVTLSYSAAKTRSIELILDASGSMNGRLADGTVKLKAQGYTPITYVIGLTAEDLKVKQTDERMVILVSDGKETCEIDQGGVRQGAGSAST